MFSSHLRPGNKIGKTLLSFCFASRCPAVVCTRFSLRLKNMNCIKTCQHCVKLVFQIFYACAWCCWRVNAFALASGMIPSARSSAVHQPSSAGVPLPSQAVALSSSKVAFSFASAEISPRLAVASSIFVTVPLLIGVVFRCPTNWNRSPSAKWQCNDDELSRTSLEWLTIGSCGLPHKADVEDERSTRKSVLRVLVFTFVSCFRPSQTCCSFLSMIVMGKRTFVSVRNFRWDTALNAWNCQLALCSYRDWQWIPGSVDLRSFIAIMTFVWCKLELS